MSFFYCFSLTKAIHVPFLLLFYLLYLIVIFFYYSDRPFSKVNTEREILICPVFF